MGLQDRDYYREWWKQRNAPTKRACYRAFVHRVVTPSQWHPVLSVLLFVAICLGVYGALRLISRF